MKRRRVFYRFLLYYALIFFLPLAFSLVAYVQFSRILERQELEANIKFLEKTRDELDARLSELERLVGVLSDDPLLLRIGFQDSRSFGPDLLLQWQLSKRLGELQKTSTLMSSLYVYFPRIERVVTANGAVDTEQFYGTHINYQNLAYDEWREAFLHNDHDGTYLPSAPVQFGNPGTEGVKVTFPMITYLKSVPPGTDRDLRAVIWLFTNVTEIRRVLRNLTEDYQTYLLSGAKTVIASSSDATPIPEIDLSRLAADRRYWSKDSNGRAIVVSGVPSRTKPWYVTTVVPAAVVVSRTIRLRRLLTVFTGLLSIAGLGIAYSLARRSAKPIRDIVDGLGRYLTMKTAGLRNEYDIIADNVRTLLNDREQLQRELDAQLPMLRSGFFARLLRGEFETDAQIRTAGRSLQLDLRGDAFLTVLLKFHFSGELGHRTRLDTLFTVASVMKRLVAEKAHRPLHSYDRADDEIVLVFCLQGEDVSQYRSVVESVVALLGTTFRRFNEIDVAISASRPCNALSDLWQCYHECTNILDSVRSRNDFTVNWHHERRHHREQYYYPLDIETRLINSARAGNVKQVRITLSMLHRENTVNRRLDPSMIQLLVNDMQCSLVKLLHQIDVADDDTGRQLIERAEKLGRSHSFDDAYGTITDLYLEICRIMDGRKASHRMALVHDIRSFIDKNYSDPGLNRSRIAERFRMSESYLSSFFKEQAGVSFTEYLEQVRLRPACELLRLNGHKILFVAESVGYSSEKAFSRAFKRVYGISPGKFRQVGA